MPLLWFYNHNQALLLASQQGHKKIVSRLLKIPTVLEQANIYKNKALKNACKAGHIEIVKLLLDVPAVAAAINDGSNYDDDKSAIMIAAQYKHQNIIDLLQAQGARLPIKLLIRQPEIPIEEPEITHDSSLTEKMTVPVIFSPIEKKATVVTQTDLLFTSKSKEDNDQSNLKL